MKKIRTFWACAVLLLSSASVVAQEQPASTEGKAVIDLAAQVDEATVRQIGESNALALENKISRIITRNGMADSEGFFAVVPTLTITNDGTVDTGMTTVRTMRGDLTLSVKNVIDNTIFGSQTISLQANGKSDEACIRAMINRVSVTDPRFAKLIQDVQQDIAAYYDRMMPRLLNKVRSLMAQEQYADAMAALSMIPETVDEWQQVCDLKVEIYNRFLEGEINRVMAECEILVRQGKIDDALNLCRGCNPLSPNYHKIVDFLNRLDAEAQAAAAAAEAAALEAEMRKLDAEQQRERKIEQAEIQGETIKAERVDTYKEKESGKPRKSLGQILFGL